MGMSQTDGRMEGWLSLIRSNRIGLQYSKKRYFILDGYHLQSFKSIPASNNEVGASSIFVFFSFFCVSVLFLSVWLLIHVKDVENCKYGQSLVLPLRLYFGYLSIHWILFTHDQHNGLGRSTCINSKMKLLSVRSFWFKLMIDFFIYLSLQTLILRWFLFSIHRVKCCLCVNIFFNE